MIDKKLLIGNLYFVKSEYDKTMFWLTMDQNDGRVHKSIKTNTIIMYLGTFLDKNGKHCWIKCLHNNKIGFISNGFPLTLTEE